MADEAIIEKYVEAGWPRAKVLEMLGAEAEEIEGEDFGCVGDDLSDEEMLELNGRLAIRAINRALTSPKIDNTLVQAAIRAVEMLEKSRRSGGGTDPEDDMLRWVAERSRDGERDMH